MHTVRAKVWSRGWRVVATLLLGTCLSVGTWRVASASEVVLSAAPGASASAAATPSSGDVAPQFDHALPSITMLQKNYDKPCSFSLYDGQKINFRDDSANCVNDEYYYFKITGAHEGMWIEIQNNPDCGNNESYAFYKVSFQDKQTGNIASTAVQLSQNKEVGTRLLDGDGNAYLLADGWRGSSQLQGAVSCVKVGQLLPDGPFQYRSKYYTSSAQCLTASDDPNGRWFVSGCGANSPTQMFFGMLNTTKQLYAGWVTRTKGFLPVVARTPDNQLKVVTPSWNPGAAFYMNYDESTQQLRVGGLCVHIIPYGPLALGPCVDSTTYQWTRQRAPGK